MSGVWGGRNATQAQPKLGDFKGASPPCLAQWSSRASESLQNMAKTRLDHFAKGRQKVAQRSGVAQ